MSEPFLPIQLLGSFGYAGSVTKPGVVLLSGGLDSATALAIASSRGFATYALSFDYGQRHCYELEAAGRVAVATIGANRAERPPAAIAKPGPRRVVGAAG